MVDLGAAIPSIIFGLWALHEFQPQITGTTSWMTRHLSFIPIFEATTPPFNASFFIAGLVVGIMIVPIVASVSREVFSLAPPGEQEGALALGRDAVPDDPHRGAPFRARRDDRRIHAGAGPSAG